MPHGRSVETRAGYDADGHADLRAYRDEEWGIPVANDERLFEEICLAGFQSDPSWLTIPRKRDIWRVSMLPALSCVS